MRRVTYSKNGITDTRIMSKEEFLNLKKDKQILVLGWKAVDNKEESV